MTAQPKAKLTFTLYQRIGCHLCDDFLDILEDFIEPYQQDASLTVCDVDSNKVWRENYGLKVPVLELNGNELCHYFFDAVSFQTNVAQIMEQNDDIRS